MANGKNFNLYLMDGDVTGRIKCTLSNWTGLAFKIPRSDLSACKEREDLKQSGVYFLFGEDQKQANRSAVYIGQAGIRKNGDLVDGILQKDLIFSSPSTAAMFVIGNSANGRVEWKTETGQTLNAVEEAELSLDDEPTATTASATKASFAGLI